MAARNLSVPTVFHSPTFPQVFTKAIQSQVRQLLATCCYVSPESIPGSCDGGYPCNEPATIHDVSTEMDYCSRHGRMVCRG